MTRITRTIMIHTITPARNRSSTMKIKLTSMAITRPLGRQIIGGSSLPVQTGADELLFERQEMTHCSHAGAFARCLKFCATLWTKARDCQKGGRDLQQDPVPRLGVILEDSHGHLASFNDHIGLPVTEKKRYILFGKKNNRLSATQNKKLSPVLWVTVFAPRTFNYPALTETSHCSTCSVNQQNVFKPDKLTDKQDA